MKLRILNETGHTELAVSKMDIMDHIQEHATHWVFVDGEMISRSDIADVNWDDVNDVDLVPAIVGGSA
jgi:sulfur carrier protein ThiS